MKNYRLLITLTLFYLCSFTSMATERIKILIFIESNNDIKNKVKSDIKEIEAIKFTNPNVEVILQYLNEKNNPIALRYNSTEECKEGCEEPDVKKHCLKDFIRKHTSTSSEYTKHYLFLIGHGILYRDSSDEIPECEVLNEKVFNNNKIKNKTRESKEIYEPFTTHYAIPKKIRFNMIMFDACSLAYIETAYELKDKTKYLAFSQCTIDGEGDALNYTKIVENIMPKNKINDENLAKRIVANFKEHNKSKKTQTFSAIGTNQISQLTDAISSFTKNTSILIKSGDRDLKCIIKKTADNTFDHPVDENKQNKLSGIDLHHFFMKLKNKVSSYPSIVLKIENILELLNKTKVESFLSVEGFTIGGLSIVYTHKKKVLKEYKKNNKLAFNKIENNWLEFLFLLTSKN